MHVRPSHMGNYSAQGTPVNTSFLSNGIGIVVTNQYENQGYGCHRKIRVLSSLNREEMIVSEQYVLINSEPDIM